MNCIWSSWLAVFSGFGATASAIMAVIFVFSMLYEAPDVKRSTLWLFVACMASVALFGATLAAMGRFDAMYCQELLQ